MSHAQQSTKLAPALESSPCVTGHHGQDLDHRFQAYPPDTLQYQSTHDIISDSDSDAQSDTWSVVHVDAACHPVDQESQSNNEWTVLECEGPNVDMAQKAMSHHSETVAGGEDRARGGAQSRSEPGPEKQDTGKRQHRLDDSEELRIAEEPSAPKPTPTGEREEPRSVSPRGIEMMHKKGEVAHLPNEANMPPQHQDHHPERQSDVDSLRELEKHCPWARTNIRSESKPARPKSRLEPQSDTESLKVLEYWTQKRAVERSWATAGRRPAYYC